MIDMRTLEQSINVIKKNGNKKISILQCTSNYPCSHENLNLSMIGEFKKKFKVPVGFLITQKEFCFYCCNIIRSINYRKTFYFR